jgi:hypothetical protein
MYVGRGSAALFESANEHGDICPRAATIGVQFVKDQEPQPPADAVEKSLILRSHE